MASLAARADSLRNTTTGMGDDKVDAGRPDLYRLPLGYAELSSLWRFGGHARRYVEVVPNDATRKGWSMEGADGEPVDLEPEHKRLQVVTRVCEADTWARLYGGAWLLMVVDEDLNGTPWANDPKGHLAEPLNPARVRALQNLVVLDWSEVTPMEFNTSARSPRYREPERYQVSPQAGGWSDPNAAGSLASGAKIHATRLVYFPGAKLPPQQRYQNNGIDDSILQSVWDQLRNTSALDHSLAALASELRITVLRMRDLSDVQVSDEAEYFDYRMRELAKHRSVLNTVLLAEGEEYQHHPGTVTGMSELVGTTRQSLQAVTGMPEQLWIGNAPGGLSTDGESHRNLWANVISAYQATKYLPRLEAIYRVMFAATAGPWGGTPPEGWRLTFNPLDELTAKGEADLRKIVADTDVAYIMAGVLDPEHVRRGRFGPKGWQFELPPADPDSFSSGADLDMGAVLALLAAPGTPQPGLPGPGADPALPGPAAPAAPTEDGSLADRRRLAESMTTAGVRKCEHGKSNRCQLCGVERRRELLQGEDGTAALGEDGAAQWGVRWAAIGDYDSTEPAAPTEDQALAVLGLPKVDAVALRELILLGMEAARRDRTHRQPAPAGPGRVDAGGDTPDPDGMVSVCLLLPLPAAAVPAWKAARLEAATLAGVTLDELDLRGHPPHVTLLWLGKVPKAEAPALQAKVVAAVEAALGLDGEQARHRTLQLQGTGLGAFAPSPGSEGDTPIYLGVQSDALRALHEVLQADLVAEDDRPPHWYRPHATVGYLAAELTAEQWTQIWESPGGRGTWTADRVELRMGGVAVGTWTLA